MPRASARNSHPSHPLHRDLYAALPEPHRASFAPHNPFHLDTLARNRSKGDGHLELCCHPRAVLSPRFPSSPPPAAPGRSDGEIGERETKEAY